VVRRHPGARLTPGSWRLGEAGLGAGGPCCLPGSWCCAGRTALRPGAALAVRLPLPHWTPAQMLPPPPPPPAAQVGRVYTISKASLTQKRPQFNSTNHDHEIRLEKFSIIEEVADEVRGSPSGGSLQPGPASRACVPRRLWPDRPQQHSALQSCTRCCWPPTRPLPAAPAARRTASPRRRTTSSRWPSWRRPRRAPSWTWWAWWSALTTGRCGPRGWGWSRCAPAAPQRGCSCCGSAPAPAHLCARHAWPAPAPAHRARPPPRCAGHHQAQRRGDAQARRHHPRRQRPLHRAHAVGRLCGQAG
jgi:hypothetical protein